MGYHKTTQHTADAKALNATSQTTPERLPGAAPAAVSGGLVVGREFLNVIGNVARAAALAAMGMEEEGADVPETMAHLPARLTIGEAAVFLECSKLEINALIETGEMEAIDIAAPGSSRQCLRIPRESLAAHYRATRLQAVSSK